MALPHQPSRVAITGLGAVSCLGGSVSEAWGSIRASRSGIRDGLGRVAESAVADAPAAWQSNRALLLGGLAAREAMKQAGWSNSEKMGLIVATTTGQLLLWDHIFKSLALDPRPSDSLRSDFKNQPLCTLLTQFSEQLQLPLGPRLLMTSACSASTQALGLASLWIRQGRVKRCLVLGVEVLTDLTTEGFRSLQLLSGEMATPFDHARGGINLSEAGAALCLEAADSAVNALAYVSGFGFSTDSYHMTGPHPDGDGCYRAMRAALGVAGLEPEQIDWVYAHGTGSQLNDLSEGLAVRRLCGSHEPWVSSTKWLHGHPLAAAGTLETIFLVKALHDKVVLATRGLKNADPKIPVKHPAEDISFAAQHVIKSTLGFGGANAALIISRGGLS